MNRTTKNSPLEKLAANVLATRFENFDQVTLEKAKSRIIDTMGCLIGGAQAPGNSELVNLVREWGGKRRGDYPDLWL